MLSIPKIFGFSRPVKSIVNAMSAGGVAGQDTVTAANAPNFGIKLALSGALSAATYKEIVAVTGHGILQIAYAYSTDTTSRTIGIKVVIDGTTVFDASCAAVTAAHKGITAVGAAPTAATLLPAPVPFASSLSISIKSSLAETDKIGLGYRYMLT